MTLIEAVLVTLMPTLNIYLSVAITLEAAIKNNPSKSRKFSSEISAVEFRYSKIIAFGIHTNFVYNYDIMKLDSDSLKFYLSLDSSFFSVYLYTVAINLVNINHRVFVFLGPRPSALSPVLSLASVSGPQFVFTGPGQPRAWACIYQPCPPNLYLLALAYDLYYRTLNLHLPSYF